MSNKKNINESTLVFQTKRPAGRRLVFLFGKRQADEWIPPIPVPYAAARKQAQGVEAPRGAEASAIQKVTASDWAVLLAS